MSERIHTLLVDAADAGKRLDKWLSEQMPECSRNYVQHLIDQQHLTRSGQPMNTASVKVKTGEQYQLIIPQVQALTLEPVKMDLDIIYEDADVIVINKPVGLSVHPSSSSKGTPTLVHGLLAHCGEQLSGIGGVARPGIVHRIDKDTSGLLVVAKNDKAHQHLSAQLKDRSLSRVYKAWVWGMPQPLSGSIETQIGRSPKNRKKMSVLKVGGKHAITHYQVDQVFRATAHGLSVAVASAITCTLETGRTHQIRVHMAHIGHGLVGDATYGSTTEGRWRAMRLPPLETDSFLSLYKRQALHACNLTLVHPSSGEQMSFSAPLPQDLVELENCLESLH